jgi:hypothetical protein
MKKLLLVTLVFVLSFSYSYHRYKLLKLEKSHWATHKIKLQNMPSIEDIFSGGKPGQHTCSSTAIGPHALLTASHCDCPGNKIEIDGLEAKIEQSIYDGHDHEIFLLSGITFKDYSNISSHIMKQRDKFFMYGNPKRQEDYYREGYVMSVENDPDYGYMNAIDLNAFFGDSGSALFNEDGDVISVISKVKLLETKDTTVQMKIMYAFDMGFRQEDLDLARKY